MATGRRPMAINRPTALFMAFLLLVVEQEGCQIDFQILAGSGCGFDNLVQFLTADRFADISIHPCVHTTLAVAFHCISGHCNYRNAATSGLFFLSNGGSSL